MKIAIILAISAAVLAAEPAKHLFREAGTLTGASSLPARQIADQFLRNAGTTGLSPGDLDGVYLFREYRTAHNGVTHLIYRQHYGGIEVHGAEWVVNVDRAGRVINAGGTLHGAPAAGLAPPDFLSARSAVRAAVADAAPRAAETYVPFETAAATANEVRFHWTPGAEIAGRAVWRAVNGALIPAWAFTVTAEDGVTSFEAVVDSGGHRVLERTPLTFFQNAPRGLVFTGHSPQPNPAPGTRLSAAPALVPRTMQALGGSATASPSGWVAGAETAGNNAVAGWNPEGVRYANPRTAAAANGDFSFPLELGAGAPNPAAYSSAATVNLFYWVNRSHDLFHEIGFDEAAGNFQQDNFGRGGSGGDPLLAYSQFGHAAPGAASLNNAFFTTRSTSDGNASMIAMFLSAAGGAFADGSYDNEVIVHEYTHGVTVRLLRGYGSFQTAAMGEAWSDFYSLEFLLPEGAPSDGVYPVGEYFTQAFGSGIRTRPYSTSVEVNSITYGDIGRVSVAPEVHADGEIWMQALWQMRANLIAQFGEREGRRRARILALDGVKLAPPAPSFVDMRDAILLADRAGFNGESQSQLWSAFAKRGLGVLAQTASANSTHVLASFETPSNSGTIRLFEPAYTLGETIRVVLHDANLDSASVPVQFTGSSGDVEQIDLLRRGSLWLGTLATSGATTVNRGDGVLSLMPGDFISAYYLDRDPGSGASRQIELTAPTRPPYTVVSSAPRFTFTGETRLNFRASAFTSRRVDLPFPFPFFGKTYSTARLYTNGLLAFELPPTASCADTATLARIAGIAPLWMEIQTNGSAQPNEDIYVSEGPDSVTYRWAAETSNFLQPTQTFPVNFALTLHRNGRIQFHYGPENKNLAVGFSPFGCAPSTPVVGISPGTETYFTTLTTHLGRPDLENALAMTFEPPFGQSSIPVGILESPLDGATAKGVLTLRGIAYDDAVPVARIDVLVDGVWRGRTTASAPRLDFCTERSVRGCPFVGFSLNVDLAALNLAHGAHTIQLRATNANGAFVDFPATPATVVIEPGQSREPFGAIEAPAAGAEVSEFVTVRGYAAAADLRIVGVDVLVDGINYGRAAYGQVRNDVCNAADPRPLNCPNIGFLLTFDSRGNIPLANGEHSLQIRVQDETGRFTLIPAAPVTFRVNNETNQPPRGVLVAPVHNERLRGDAAIYGHAWDPDGRVVQVQLLINGEIRALVPYGRPRPEECAALPDVEACPNIGFEFALDTRRLNNGANVIGIRLIDDRGRAVVIPNTLRNGINVFVEN